jgi:N-acetylmuramoyl-L-alanine amidase
MAVKVKNHRLVNNSGKPFPYKESPNRSNTIDPKYLIIHYTAGSSASGSISWLTNKKSKVSAHIVIARDGTVTQLVPFNIKAWHAGHSVWAGLYGINNYSIGIEMDNAGKLVKKGGKWYSNLTKREYPDSEVLEAEHKHGGGIVGWHDYTAEQIDAAIQLGALLVEEYKLKDVLGHEDISPGRKIDPGPAWPMENYRAKIIGRRDDEIEEYETITNLNIRQGPGTEYDKILETPLPPGTNLAVLDIDGAWMFVDILDEIKDDSDIEGWVHGKYLRLVSSPTFVEVPDTQSKPTGKLISKQQLQEIMPHATKSNINKYLGPLNETMKKYNINTYLRITHFIAQLAHESGSFRYSEEIASGAAYEGRTDLGNINPGDGVKFKGRGLIQLTGRSNYTKYGDYVVVDLTKNPSSVSSDPKLATDVAGWYWMRKKISVPADRDDVEKVTRLINGGLNGFEDRKNYLKSAKRILS